VAEVERAISAAGHVIVDMADFPAADRPPAQVCVERVRGCEVYVGVLGTRYGSPVRDKPEVSYTELEFDTATETGMHRLMFLLDTTADDVGIPVSRLIDYEFGNRQGAFRRRVQDSGLTTQSFADPATLGRLVERSLRELTAAHGRSGSRIAREQISPVLGVSAVTVDAAAKDPGPVFTAVGVETFTGRDWLADEVDRFIAANPCGYIFVEAEAGLGKTAFAAWLVKTRAYVAHFSCYVGGWSVRAALRNLSAQLVREFGLAEVASGGMLAEWAQTPGGFESVLGMAATRAREAGHDIVLVVDGLDEAEPSQEGLAFGLPALLPRGVYVIGTYRTGRSPGHPDAPAVTVPISKGDPRNVSDIRSFLRRAVAEEVLAAQLAQATVDPENFIDVLAERCDGVWVYLRYVLQEVRMGLRSPATVGDLPSGLWDYYANLIRTWQKDPAWDDSLLPLLATLGVAGDPLPTAMLARLAGDLDPVAVRRWCDFTLRALLTATRDAEADGPLRYEIYHASFRELLKALPGERSAEVGDRRSYDVQALADELRQATLRAHRSIADTYLASFGGLDVDLPLLAGNPVVASIDDGYPLRHLARHLDHAGRASELHQLLAVAHTDSSGHEVSVWFTAHDRADRLASYLDDLARAQHRSATTTDDALARHQPAWSLGTEIRYTLMASSITSRAARISPNLLDLLVHTGLWSSGRCLDHARRLAAPQDRFRALFAIQPNVNPAERPLILEEALATASAISGEYNRAEALTALAPHLPADLLGQALATASAISGESARARALTALAPHLLPDLRASALGEALATTAAISGEYDQAEALTALAPHLPQDQRASALGQALSTAAAISGESARARVLAALAPDLPPDLLGQALSTASAISGESARARALTALAPHLPLDERASALDQALATASAISGESARVRALAALAPHLLPDQRVSALGDALATASAISGESGRAEALAALAPHLPSDLLGEALSTATAISGESDRAEALTALAPHLPPDLLSQALATASAITGESVRAGALTALAPHLPPDQRASALSQALATAAAISGESARAEALTALAPHLPPDQRASALAQALATATAISDEYDQAETLTALASHLPPDQRASALAEALAIASAISGESVRAEALTALAPHLSPDQRASALSEALATAAAISGESARARALAALAPHLPPVQLGQGLAAASAISGESARAQALIALAPHLPPDQRASALGEALAAATAISDEYDQAETLTALAPHLPSDLLGRALAAGFAISGESARARALAALAPHLPPHLLGQALSTATAASGESARARALAALAPHLPPDLVGQALAAASAISGEYDRAETLTALAPHLPSDQRASALGEALAAATATSDEYARADALTALAPHLPPDLVGQALAAASAISGEYDRAETLTALAPHLPLNLRASALSAALAAATAIRDESARARALTALAPHLPSDQRASALGEALATATAISDEYARARALTALAPHLPPDQLGQALASAPKGNIEPTASLLEKGRRVLVPTGDEVLLSLARISLRGADRSSCLRVIGLLAPDIAQIGGTAAIHDCWRAISDTHRWWP